MLTFVIRLKGQRNTEKTEPQQYKTFDCHYRSCLLIDFPTVRQVSVNGTLLPFYEKVKNLGLTMNCTLTWTDAVTETCKKVFTPHYSLLTNFLFVYFVLKTADYRNCPVNDLPDC